MSKARITYRFDQRINQPPLEENRAQPVPPALEREAGKVIPLYQEDETTRIERLIRSSQADQSKHADHAAGRGSPLQADENQEAGAPLYYTASEAEQVFQHLPFYEDTPAAVSFVRKARHKGNWLGLMSAVTGAVLTGLLLGMFVLSLFQERGNLLPVTSESDPILQSVKVPVDTLSDNIESPGDEGNEPLGIQPVSVSGIGGSYYLVQNGVFSSQEGAELAATQLKDSGFAGAIEKQEQWIVYAGAAQDRDDALLISEHMREEGLEVFIKPFELPAGRTFTWVSSEPDLLQRYLSAGQQLVDQLIAVSVPHLHQASPKPLGDEQIAALQSSHQTWTTEVNQLAMTGSDLEKVLIQGMNTALNSGMKSIEQYQKKPSTAYMWQVQSSAAEYLIQVKQFMSE